MRNRSWCVALLLAGACALPVAQLLGQENQNQEMTADVQTERLQLVKFDANFNVANPGNNGTTGRLIETRSGPGVEITSPAGGWYPGFHIDPPNGQWDLSKYEYISFDIHNIDSRDLDLGVRIDSKSPDGTESNIGHRAGIQPDQRSTIVVPLSRSGGNADIKLAGMIAFPQGLYPGTKGLDTKHVFTIKPFIASSDAPAAKFVISNIFAAGQYVEPTWLKMTPAEFFPMLDAFGQFRHKDWPGKIKSVEDMHAARDAEAKALEADKGPAEWNQYGGWANGPQLKATGSFRTEKVDGKWWLVDPEGRLFFSVGPCVVRPSGAVTPIVNRDGWFTDLPAVDGPGKEFYGFKEVEGKRTADTFNHTAQNLQLKYGVNWKDAEADIVHKRLRTWGMNTIANWSDWRIMKMKRTPYTAVMFYDAPKLRAKHSGFPDVFDAKFAPAVQAGAKQFLAGTKGDPFCIGYFVDNEMPWGGETTLAEDALKQTPDRAAKKELLKTLKKKYTDIAALNTAWGSSYASWDDLAKPAADKFIAPDGARADLTEFTTRIAELYFRTVRDAVKAIDPDKMYLGCRSVGGARNIAEQMVKYCDVSSYNIYAHSVRGHRLPEGLDGPTLIGEFHFCATDRGLFGTGLVSADSQADRARKYKDYVLSSLENPQIVGVHWFQYGDESVTGRPMDGENYQCGLVDVADNPYTETVEAARQVGEMMYKHRQDAK